LDGCRPPQPMILLFQSFPQTLQPSEFVIFVVKGYREFVSYSEFPWQIISGFPVIERLHRTRAGAPCLTRTLFLKARLR
jgi:hypothetical protein